MINTIKHLAFLLGSSEVKLESIINHIDGYYYDTLKPKKKYGKYQRNKRGEIRYRDLCVSIQPLKGIQQRINSLIQQIELPSYAYGSVKGKNHILNAQEHINSKYFFTVDLKNFFSNISHHQVHEMFEKNKFSPTTSRILTQLTTYRGGLPQGPPSSPLISNLVFGQTGLKLIEAIKNRQIKFTTYLDDLTFSPKRDFKSLIPVLLEIIQSDGFKLNHEKIHYRTHRSEVTGIMVCAGKLWPIKKMVEEANHNTNLAAYIKYVMRFREGIR